MKITHSKNNLLAIAGISLLAVSSAYSAVVIQSSFNNGVVSLDRNVDIVETDGIFTYTVSAASLGSFDATAGDKLVLGYTSRRIDPFPDGNVSQSGAPLASITIGSASLNLVEQITGGRINHSIWYLDNVPANGDLVFNLGSSNATDVIGFSLYSISGLVAGTAASSGSSLGSAAVPTVELGAGGGFVFNATARNNSNVSGNDDYTVEWIDNSNVMRRGLHQYLVTADGGSFAPDGNNADGVQATAAFQAIPEPTTALLGGLGMLMLLRRRRA